MDNPERSAGHEADLEARLHAVTRELVNVYHDISNPVSALAGNIDLLAVLMQEVEVDDAIRETVRDLGLAQQRLSEVLDRLRVLRNALRSGEPI